MASHTATIHLPDEIWLEILSNLPIIRTHKFQCVSVQEQHEEKERQFENKVRQKTLYSICLTCRRLNSITTPILYSSFHVPSTWGGMKAIQLFHHTISTPAQRSGRLPLKDHVRYIENHVADHLSKSLSDSSVRGEVEKMINQCFDALAGTIRLCTNLQHLRIMSFDTPRLSFWQRMIPVQDVEEHRLAEHGFSNLTALSIRTICQGDDSILDLSVINFITERFPFLHDLRVCGINNWSTFDPDIPFAFNQSFRHLQRLEITNAMITLEETSCILLACVRLRHILLHWSALSCMGMQASSIIYPGLLKQKATLETLLVDMSFVRFFRGFDHPDDLIGSFESFHRLKALEISDYIFPAPEMFIVDDPDVIPDERIMSLLPRSMEHLVLFFDQSTGFHDEVDLDQVILLWHLVEDYKQFPTALKRVTIKMAANMRGPKLSQAFANAGVEMKIMSNARLL